MAKKENMHTSHMHGLSRHHHGERPDTGGQTRPAMHGRRRAHPTALPANVRRDVWRRRAEAPK